MCQSDSDKYGVSTESNPSLTLDLGSAKQIAYVAVYNREDCCRHRLGRYTVSLRLGSSDAWTLCSEETAEPDAFGPLLSDCPQLAQYVRVQLPGDNRTLALTEVEVYSHPPPPSLPSPPSSPPTSPPSSPPTPPPSPPPPPSSPPSRQGRRRRQGRRQGQRRALLGRFGIGFARAQVCTYTWHVFLLPSHACRRPRSRQAAGAERGCPSNPTVK